eukprot:5737415-Pleurochrysis_carterae.AAC.1
MLSASRHSSCEHIASCKSGGDVPTWESDAGHYIVFKESIIIPYTAWWPSRVPRASFVCATADPTFVGTTCRDPSKVLGTTCRDPTSVCMLHIESAPPQPSTPPSSYFQTDLGDG